MLRPILRSAQVAWLSGLMDFVFPYLVQFLREYTGKVGLFPP